MSYYILECNGRQSVFRSLSEALHYALSSCGGSVRVYRANLILSLEEQELEELKKLLAGKERLVEKKPVGGEARCIAVIFDQMFKGFAEIVDRELEAYCIELHEVVGRGLERTVKVGKRLYREPARDDYDVLALAERLAKEMPVVLFTGDKKLAEQASLLRNVHVEYMPPSEFTGKEMAVRHMIATLKRLLEGDETPR